MRELLDSSPELAEFAVLSETSSVSSTRASLAETEQVLRTHPVLLIPTADKALADLAAAQTNEAARERVEMFRMILARCREVGVARGIAEARLQFET